MVADPVADQAGDGVGGERGEAVRALSGPVAGELDGFLGEFVGPVGDDEEHGEVLGARGEGVEPAEGLGVGPVGVVEDDHERGAADGEVVEDPVEAVAQALGVGRGAGGGAQSEGGADDVVPGAEAFAEFGVGGVDELGLEELAGDVEGDALLLVAAAGGEDGAAAGRGAAADLGEEGGLAESGGRGVGEEAAAPGGGVGDLGLAGAAVQRDDVGDAGPARSGDALGARGRSGRKGRIGLGDSGQEVEGLLGGVQRRLPFEEAEALAARPAVLSCHVPPPHRGREPGARSGRRGRSPREKPSVRRNAPPVTALAQWLPMGYRTIDREGRDRLGSRSTNECSESAPAVPLACRP
ncbi:hypothetical protein GCM10010305_41070 [Streptomyces termitum]|uniref:Uncharacterized protein n=1 Tax=Streptomyces termitum TaxID=67368 RepID=A0A918T5L9_9ACTN|nr:hypothetical protein GCM10010305_41070 [Streptomyces termitum]